MHLCIIIFKNMTSMLHSKIHVVPNHNLLLGKKMSAEIVHSMHRRRLHK